MESKIKEYRHEYGITQTVFGARLSQPVSQGMVRQWELWEIKPRDKNATKITPERAISIEAATNRHISKHDLRPDIFGKAA